MKEVDGFTRGIATMGVNREDPVSKEKIDSNLKKSRDMKFYDSAYYTETVIEYPIEKVWPHILNINGWLIDDEFITQTVSGEEGEVGHIVKMVRLGVSDETPLPHYHFYKLTEVIPNKLFTLKGFSEEGGSYGLPEKLGFETFILTEDNGNARVSLIYNAERIRDDSQSIENIASSIREENRKFDNLFVRFWNNLRQLIENST